LHRRRRLGIGLVCNAVQRLQPEPLHRVEQMLGRRVEIAARRRGVGPCRSARSAASPQPCVGGRAVEREGPNGLPVATSTVASWVWARARLARRPLGAPAATISASTPRAQPDPDASPGCRCVGRAGAERALFYNLTRASGIGCGETRGPSSYQRLLAWGVERRNDPATLLRAAANGPTKTPQPPTTPRSRAAGSR
jgi:hypothetical protein